MAGVPSCARGRWMLETRGAWPPGLRLAQAGRRPLALDARQSMVHAPWPKVCCGRDPPRADANSNYPVHACTYVCACACTCACASAFALGHGLGLLLAWPAPRGTQ